MAFKHLSPTRILAMAVLLFLGTTSNTVAQSTDSQYYSMLRWRMIGPYRGGRTVGACGVLQHPNEFYIGVNNGGVWKTTDYGRTWKPFFDDQPTGSIGDVAVAPSNPNTVYVASGEGLQRPDLSVGNGVYKSADAGKTWSNTGLSDCRQIGSLAIDPNDENTVFVAALGHPYGANKERGIYKTTDGGKTWVQKLYIDENTGAIQVTLDPHNPKTVYADMWAGRLAPWENGMWQGEKSGLFKSTDGGDTWKKLTNGLPDSSDGLGRIGFCIAPSNPQRLFALADAAKGAGLYRSDDGGASWRMVNPDKRLWERGTDFAECKVDPKNENIVYVANVVTWKSTDGGISFSAFRGAPGGDDYHRLWINPKHPETILLAGDQGAIITVNGGETWSSWYNQPTAQFYHVSTDNAFPYNVYGGQQESGSVGISSRGNDGVITFRDWHPVAAEEYGYVAADPLDPNIIYGGKLSRYDKRTGQAQQVGPDALRSNNYRFLRTAPVLFSPIDHKTLYFAGNVLFKTLNGGKDWQTISPDLTRKTYDVPDCIGVYKDEKMKTMPQRGVIYAVAPSNKNINTIWAGTDDGLVHITRNGGKTWANITHPDLTSWSKVSMIDASHTADHTAYVAVNKIRLNDMKPYIYKLTDYGKHWKKITGGLPDEPINTVREDPKCRGLLFAGSENAVYVSLDDGENWQALRMNMPCTSIRDLVIKDDDLVIGTHGRSFWIMDNIQPLRYLATKKQHDTTQLYPTATTYRVRWNMNTDTPLPQEEAAGENPPDGAVIDYYLANDNDHVTLEIMDDKQQVVNKFTNNDQPYKIPELNIPTYWIRPQQILQASAGAHRFIWNLHYTSTASMASFPMAAVYENTAPADSSPWVAPGTYTVRLTANGKVYTRPLVVKMDPRVKTAPSELRNIHNLSMTCYRDIIAANTIAKQLKSAPQEIINARNNSIAFDAQYQRFEAKLTTFLALQAKDPKHSLETLTQHLHHLMTELEASEMPPTTTVVTGVKETHAAFQELYKKWQEVESVRPGK